MCSVRTYPLHRVVNINKSIYSLIHIIKSYFIKVSRKGVDSVRRDNNFVKVCHCPPDYIYPAKCVFLSPFEISSTEEKRQSLKRPRQRCSYAGSSFPRRFPLLPFLPLGAVGLTGSKIDTVRELFHGMELFLRASWMFLYGVSST